MPTWTYLAIHLTGELAPMPDSALPDLLARQSAHFEAELAPKPAWQMTKLAPGTAAKMMRQICPYQLTITQIDSTWKLSQNKPEAARLAAADHLGVQGPGRDTKLLAALMRRPPG